MNSKKNDVDPMTLSLRASQVAVLRKFIEAALCDREGIDLGDLNPLDDLNPAERETFDALAKILGVALVDGPTCDICGGRFDDLEDGICGECGKPDEAQRFRVVVDFAFEGERASYREELKASAEKFGLEVRVLQEEGPGGGWPEVEYVGTFEAVRALCEWRGADDAEFIEEVE